MNIYLAHPDKNLLSGCHRLCARSDYRLFVHGDGLKRRVFGTSQNRADLKKVTRLYLIGHSGSAPRWFGKIWFYNGDEEDRHAFPTKSFTAAEMAEQLISDGVPKQLSDLRLMVCFSGTWKAGEAPSEDGEKAPLAAKLCSELKTRGFKNIRVTGYNGFVALPKLVALPGINVNMGRPGAAHNEVSGGTKDLFELLAADATGAGTLSNDVRSVWY